MWLTNGLWRCPSIDVNTRMSSPRCDSIPITWWIHDWGTTAFRAHSKVDIITTYPVLNRWEYKIKAYTRHKLQHEYNNSSIHRNHHEEEQDPTTDEIKRKRRMISTLLIIGSPTRNLTLDRRRRRTPKVIKHHSHLRSSHYLYLQLLL